MLHGRHVMMMVVLWGLHSPPPHLLVISGWTMVEHVVAGGPRVLPPVPRHCARDRTSLFRNGFESVHYGRNLVRSKNTFFRILITQYQCFVVYRKEGTIFSSVTFCD